MIPKFLEINLGRVWMYLIKILNLIESKEFFDIN